MNQLRCQKQRFRTATASKMASTTSSTIRHFLSCRGVLPTMEKRSSLPSLSSSSVSMNIRNNKNYDNKNNSGSIEKLIVGDHPLHHSHDRLLGRSNRFFHSNTTTTMTRNTSTLTSTSRWLSTTTTIVQDDNDVNVDGNADDHDDGLIRKYVETRGCKFQVTISNINGKYPILLLPGALGTAMSDFGNLLLQHNDNDNNDNDNTMNGLGNEFALYALDLRGLGGSRQRSMISSSSSNEEKDDDNMITRDYPLNFYLRDALDAASVMSNLGHTSFTVFGWSDGANTAMHLAAANSLTTQVYVNGLIVWGGNAYVTQDDVDAWESLRNIDAWSERVRDEKITIHGGSKEYFQQLVEDATDGWINLYKHPTTAGDVLLKELHRIKCPTLILHGKKDIICDIKHANYIANQIQNSELIIFPDGKHNIHQRLESDFIATSREYLLSNIYSNTKDNMVLKDIADDRDDDEPAIDQIAYAFMGSKALSVALSIGLFDAIDKISKDSIYGHASFDRIKMECNTVIPVERLKTLLNACVSLKLIKRKVGGMSSGSGGIVYDDVKGTEDVFFLPKASEQQLVKTSKRYWGDYILNQVDGQFYNRMKELDQTMKTGNTNSDGYETWFEKDPVAAKRYTLAQHNGSVATAYAMLKKLESMQNVLLHDGTSNDSNRISMLDVGGGSGAFSIVTAKKFHNAHCVVLDLPNVIKTTNEIIAEEENVNPFIANRVKTLSLSAIEPGDWNDIVSDESYDVVLMSYVSGSIPSFALQGLYDNAYRVLKPGGIIIIHDFFVSNAGDGPQNAALWALAHVTVNPDGMGLRPNRIVEMITDSGFIGPQIDELIPQTTTLIVASKPSTGTSP